MKRGLTIFFCALFLLSFQGCGSGTVKNAKQELKPKVEETKPELKGVLPEGQKETGSGKIYVSTASGQTQTSVVPVLYVKGDEAAIQIGLKTENLSPSSLSYIYVNKVFLSKEQLSNSQISLNLPKDILKPGVYTVAVVQYENNDTTAKVIEYHEGKFEVKKS